MRSPKAPLLKECTKILKGAAKCKKLRELEFKNIFCDSVADSVLGWSVNSDGIISATSDEDSEEDFANRLKELESGTKLRRKSTMVSTFGFKRQSCKLQAQRRTSIVSKFPIVTIPKIAIKRDPNLSPIKEDVKKNFEHSEKVKNLLKVCNKRKIDPKEAAGEALLFLNQLGRKLLIKQQQRMKKRIAKNVSIQNDKIESVTSDLSLSSQEETRNTPIPKGMMSPIKTRKQILKTNLNCEQKNTLNLWRAYKAGDKLSFSSDSEGGQRNSSQTPVMRHIFFQKSGSNTKCEDTKSCTKVSQKKTKKKKKVKAKKSKASKANKKSKTGIEENMLNNMITLTNKAKSGEKSPKKKKQKKKVRYGNPNRHHPCSSIVENLNDILNNMEEQKPIEEEKPRKGSMRKMSCEIRGEKEVSSPKKSPRKSPKKMRQRRRRMNSKKSIRKISKKKRENPKGPLKTMMDISAIVANLDEVLAYDDSTGMESQTATLNRFNSETNKSAMPIHYRRFASSSNIHF